MIESPFRFPLFSITLAVFVILASANLAVSQKSLTREQVLQDAKTTEGLLKKFHPNLHAHRAPEQLRKLWRNARSQVPKSPNILDSVTLSQKMLAAVCDEHTSVTLNYQWIIDNISEYRIFPTGLIIIGDKIYLDDYDFPKAPKEIIGINKRSSEEIIGFIRSILSFDGCQNSEKLFTRHHDFNSFISIILTNFLNLESRYFDVTYRNVNKAATKTLNLWPVSYKKLHDAFRTWSVYGRRSPLKSLGIEAGLYDWMSTNRMTRQMIVRTNKKRSIYYVYLTGFNEGEVQERYIDQEMRDLVKSNPDHVILDLTDNSGGAAVSAQRLMSYFLKTSSRVWTSIRTRARSNISDPNFNWWNEEERNSYTKFVRHFRRARKKRGQYTLSVARKSFGNKSYRGKVTVLVSPKTGSAATIVATILKRKIGANVVGDIGDASMKTVCMRPPGAHLLPNSKAAILVPTLCGDRHRDAKTKGNLLEPDVPVDITVDNSRKTNVVILNAAIEALGLEKGAGLAKAD